MTEIQNRNKNALSFLPFVSMICVTWTIFSKCSTCT